MRLINSIPEMREFSRHCREHHRTLALVPTMGSLHAGHLTLVRRGANEADVLVVSIFVNPTQFGPTEDFTRYPRDLERDLDLLLPLDVDAVFAPESSEMYPAGFETSVDPGPLGAPLEGAARPGHFRGVATIVLKLFNTVTPDVAIFGQKDFQQAAIIRRMICDFNLSVRMVLSPIAREPDGLAMSSRNAYLTPEDRGAATVLYRSLERARELFASGERDAAGIAQEMWVVFTTETRAELEYAVIVDPEHLQPVNQAVAGSVALVAARLGGTRLIDNLIFSSAPMG
jgi:pantoate--beta-alanine ligase